MSDIKKIGILGGTFNPIHMGHLILAEHAYSEFGLDEIMLIPTGVSYFKDPNVVLDKNIRLEMAREAVKNNDHFTVSTIETSREGNTYTYETLETLKGANPGHIYYFIIGADTLFQIENWRRPDIVFANAIILCAVREGQSLEELRGKAEELINEFSADIKILECPYIDISSTDIRKRISEGKSVRYMITDTTLEYIEKNRLYK